MICSTGTATPTSGVYGIKLRWEWLSLFGNVYGHYSTQITGNILFHSPSSIGFEPFQKLFSGNNNALAEVLCRKIPLSHQLVYLGAREPQEILKRFCVEHQRQLIIAFVLAIIHAAFLLDGRFENKKGRHQTQDAFRIPHFDTYPSFPYSQTGG